MIAPYSFATICNISYLHLIIKQKNASPENCSKCTYDLIAFSRLTALQITMRHWADVAPEKSLTLDQYRQRRLARPCFVQRPNIEPISLSSCFANIGPMLKSTMFILLLLFLLPFIKFIISIIFEGWLPSQCTPVDSSRHSHGDILF